MPFLLTGGSDRPSRSLELRCILHPRCCAVRSAHHPCGTGQIEQHAGKRYDCRARADLEFESASRSMINEKIFALSFLQTVDGSMILVV